MIINRPVVAGAALRTPSSLIKSVSQLSFVKISSNFWLCEKSAMALGKSFTCGDWLLLLLALSIFFLFLLFSKRNELVSGGSVINRAYPVYFLLLLSRIVIKDWPRCLFIVLCYFIQTTYSKFCNRKRS